MSNDSALTPELLDGALAEWDSLAFFAYDEFTRKGRGAVGLERDPEAERRGSRRDPQIRYVRLMTDITYNSITGVRPRLSSTCTGIASFGRISMTLHSRNLVRTNPEKALLPSSAA